MRFGKTRMEGKSGVERDGTTRGGVGWEGGAISGREKSRGCYVDGTSVKSRGVLN